MRTKLISPHSIGQEYTLQLHAFPVGFEHGTKNTATSGRLLRRPRTVPRIRRRSPLAGWCHLPALRQQERCMATEVQPLAVQCTPRSAPVHRQDRHYLRGFPRSASTNGYAAMWQVINCKNGVSSYEVHRAIGVTQKTAWFMDHRIRYALTTGTIDKLDRRSRSRRNLHRRQGSQHAHGRPQAAHHCNRPDWQNCRVRGAGAVEG